MTGLFTFTALLTENTGMVRICGDRFKFVDDLSILEIINLLTVGLTSFNIKQEVASDIPPHNQFIPAENLQSQVWLDKIDSWTENPKMMINEKKTKTMIFNFTDRFQFTTRLKLKNDNIEVIKSTKLLGTILSADLKWDLNTASITKKANARMELLRKVASFDPPTEDLKDIYILFIRSILEQSARVWHSSITEENSNDLERIQKSAVKIMLKGKYTDYKKGLAELGLLSLEERREHLCLNFAKKCVKSDKLKHMFPKNDKSHNMGTRNEEVFKVQHANTGRLKKSPIIYMQNLLNDDEMKNRD